MKVENAIPPNAEQMKGFREPGPEGPIFMLNLLKFKDQAEYEDGRETGLTGREAYALYSKAVGKLLVRHGGGRVFLGKVTRLMLGEVEDLWDIVGISQYPNRRAMLDMMISLANSYFKPLPVGETDHDNAFAIGNLRESVRSSLFELCLSDDMAPIFHLLDEDKLTCQHP